MRNAMRSGRRRLAVILAGVALLLPSPGGGAATERSTILEHVERLRAIRPDADTATTARYNREMDEAWSAFEADLPRALPVLREVVASEIRKPQPSQLLLLDLGYFLELKGSAAERAVAHDALAALDPTARVVVQNDKELFEFTHLVAAERDPRVLALIDRAFLRGDTVVYVPQHALKLDATLVCAYLYGIYGEGAEAHLARQLADPAVARRTIEVLIWIGSPLSIGPVVATYSRQRNRETFGRVATFLMKVGGPAGRQALLAMRPSSLDVESRKYFEEVLPRARQVDYASLRQPFAPSTAPAPMSDRQVRDRLEAAVRNHGKDDSFNPISVLDSRVPAEELIGALARLRSATFHRISDEALGDVEATNALINALRYRGR